MRVKSLDGIRGLAILLVLADHVLGFVPGWVGVDLFFVLSGYLITTLLRRDRGDRHFRSPFYIKRATRILPPLIVLFVLAAILTNFPWRTLGIYFVLFAANIGQVVHPLTGDKELSVLWSLAVEEHFYLVWPFAVRYLDRKALIGVLLAVLALSPVLRGLFTHRLGWWPIYILTPFRLDGLAAGSLLAVAVEDHRWAERLKKVAGPVSAVLFVGYAVASLAPRFWFQADSLSYNVFGYTLLTAILTFGLSYVVLHEASLASRILSMPWLAFVGLISYGVYLYHVMVVRAMQLFVRAIGYDHMRTFAPVTLAITFALAWASFKWYESPIVTWGKVRARQLNHRPDLDPLPE